MYGRPTSFHGHGYDIHKGTRHRFPNINYTECRRGEGVRLAQRGRERSWHRPWRASVDYFGHQHGLVHVSRRPGVSLDPDLLDSKNRANDLPALYMYPAMRPRSQYVQRPRLMSERDAKGRGARNRRKSVEAKIGVEADVEIENEDLPKFLIVVVDPSQVLTRSTLEACGV